MASTVSEIGIDCADPETLTRFWCAALGYRVLERTDEFVTIGDPARDRVMLTFARVPEPKAVKNRLHLDLRPSDRGRDEEVERLLALGARRIDVAGDADSVPGELVDWVVLADPEGNEFCVLAGSDPVSPPGS